MRDEAEEYDRITLRMHPLEDERLVDLAVDLLEYRRELGQRHDHFGRNERRAEALEAHRCEPGLPFVLGHLGSKVGTTRTLENLGKRPVDGGAA